MDEASSLLLSRLLRERSVASVATLHDGLPFASMIPFAVASGDAGGLQFVTHVSRLASHTRDMLQSPAVCLLITAADAAAPMPQALPRVSIPARATFIDPSHPDYPRLRAAYLGKFPDTADFFQFGDFSIVALEPAAARFVAGFGRAMTVSPVQLADVYRGSASDGDGSA